MAETIRWGIMSTGNIAHKFAEGLRVVNDAQLVGVGSRSQASADEFAREFNVPHAHPTYEALVADPEVDVVYVSSPHPYHFDNVMLALNAGKHVLCEKPFTLNAGELEKLIQTARANGLFLMEAMWTRFLPHMVKIRELIAQGAIGDIRMVQADLGFRKEFDPTHRVFDPNLGGGSLLDVGIYPISFAFMLLGEPSAIQSAATLGQTGTDDQSAYLFTYPNGQIALLSSAVYTQTPTEATIAGTTGMIRVESPSWWIRPSDFRLIPAEGDAQTFSEPFVGNGYNYQAVEVGNCLRAGKTESTTMPLDESLRIMRTMDTIRAPWGLVYPAER